MSFKNSKLTFTLAAVLALYCQLAIGQQHGSKLENTFEGLQGVLEPWRTSEVASSETGLVEKILVKVGDRVKIGDRLAELKSESIKLQLELAETQVAAQGRIETATADVTLNERKVTAFKEARKKDFSSQMELERAQMDLDSARGRLKTEAEERIVLELRASQLRQILKDRIVVAPIEGEVTEIRREAGELVAPNAPEIVRIVDVSKLRARFYLTEQEVERLPADGSVMVELSSGRRVQATIEHVAPVADKESGLLVSSVLIENPNSDIRSSRCSLLLNSSAK